MAFEEFLSAEEIKAMQLAEANSDKQQKRTPEQIEAIYTHGQNVLVSALSQPLQSKRLVN